MSSYEEALTGFCEKLVRLEESPECTLLACKKTDTAILLALSRYKDWVYAKAVPQEAIPVAYWNCNNIFYTPYGLYIFAKNPSELAEKLREKHRLLTAIAKLAMERVVAGEA